jgi:hypothetical protein
MMKTAFLKPAALILVLYAAAGLVTNSQTTKKPAPAGDVKIRQRMSMSGSGTETILYIKGQRMRNEMAGSMGYTTILQCDLKRTLTINEKTKTYMISPTGGANTGDAGDGGAGAPTGSTAQPQTPQRGGIVNVTNTVTDTGERKQMFGFTARHIKTSMETKASPEACAKDSKIETDGWYIDFEYAYACPGETQKYQPTPVRPQSECKDEVRTRTVGPAKLGFPLLVTTTVYQSEGRTTTMTQEVLELSREPLSASLFDVPEGYTLAKDMQEFYGMSTAATTPSTSSRPSESNTTSSAATTTTATGATADKKPGMIRIGLVLPKVQVTAGDVAQSAEAVRNTFATRLNAPGVEVVMLNSASASEARQKQCDYMLSVSMTVKKGGGGSMFGRTIGNIAGSAAGHIPGGSTAGSAAARSATIAGVYTAATIADNVKAKDELSLEYRLDRADSPNTVIADTGKAKAKSDGEDILTPQVDKAAQAVLTAVKK